MATGIDWYERRNELEEGQIFRAFDGSIVKLDRGVAGDATRRFVATWHPGYDLGGNNKAAAGWSYDDSTIEPGDLSERLPDDWKG